MASRSSSIKSKSISKSRTRSQKHSPQGRNITREKEEIARMLNEQDSSLEKDSIHPGELSNMKHSGTPQLPQISENDLTSLSRDISSPQIETVKPVEDQPLSLFQIKDKLNTQAGTLLNKYKNLKMIDKSERERELGRLWKEELDFQESDNSKIDPDCKSEMEMQVKCRREQIDTLEWVLTSKKNKEKALEEAIKAKITLNFRSILDHFKSVVELTDPTPAEVLDEIRIKSNKITQLELKEREWSEWFMNQILSKGQPNEQQISKNILEQSLDVQLKRKKNIVSLGEEIKKMKTINNSKVILLKKSRA